MSESDLDDGDAGYANPADTNASDADPAGPHGNEVKAAGAGRGRPGKRVNAALEGAQLVARSKYLLGIALLLGFYEVVSNIIDFQLAAMVEAQIAGALEKDAFFGLLGQITGIASIVIQLLVTTYVMRRFGVGVALLFLPLSILVGSLGFLVVPTIALAAYMSASDNALNYSINQSAREALYTPTTQDEKYKAKAFIDMFVQRGAKVLAVGINLGLTALLIAQVRWLSIAVLAILVGWIVIVRFLGRRFESRAAEAAPQAAVTTPA